MCLGQATRVIEYLMDACKVYQGAIRLGRATDTYDRTGTAVAEVDASGVRREAVERALKAFEGAIEQRPPPYSALKRDGVPLYKLARAGQTVETEPRPVHVYRLALLSFEPPFARIEVECGKGTYIRSLAHDLGAALGVGGSLEELVRTRVGPFDIAAGVDIETLRAEFESGTWRDRLLSADEVLLEWPAAILGPENQRLIRNGRRAEVDLIRTGEARVRVYTTDGEFLAVADVEGDRGLRAAKVFNLTQEAGSGSP